MKVTILTIAGLILLVGILSNLAKKFLTSVLTEKDKLDLEQDDIYFVPPNDNIQNDKRKVENLIVKEEKIVLSVENDSSSSNPRKKKDWNNKQNLNTKYNKNTYRSKNGRYSSLKEIV